MTVFHLPIEPLVERYTAQWYVWFDKEFRRQGVDFMTIDGEALSNSVVTGTFLDVNSTLHYKATQLQQVARLFYERRVRAGDVFFVADIEYWGIEALRYLSDLNGIPIKIAGFCHAGSYTRGDIMQRCEKYAKYFEEGWFRVCDKVFLGSEYHKSRIITTQRIKAHEADKLIVTGNPFKSSDMQSFREIEKKHQVILSNRPDPEKNPAATLALFSRLKKRHPDWRFIATTSRQTWGAGALRDMALAMQDAGIVTIHEGLTKAEYYALLAESQVMTGNTIEENFGYCILEALLLNTIPVVENKFSHNELIPDWRCLFTDQNDQMRLIEQAMEEPFSVWQHGTRFDQSLERIVKECVEW